MSSNKQAIARQQINDRGSNGSGVFYVVRPEAI
jgi:hypothetical protein